MHRTVSKRNDPVTVACLNCGNPMQIEQPMNHLFEAVDLSCPECGQSYQASLSLKHGTITCHLQQKQMKSRIRRLFR